MPVIILDSSCLLSKKCPFTKWKLESPASKVLSCLSFKKDRSCNCIEFLLTVWLTCRNVFFKKPVSCLLITHNLAVIDSEYFYVQVRPLYVPGLCALVRSQFLFSVSVVFSPSSSDACRFWVIHLGPGC